MFLEHLFKTVWLVRAREPFLVSTPWICWTRLVPFFIEQLQAVEKSSQNLSFHRLHSLIPVFSGYNLSFYIVANCLAIILFSVSLLQHLSVFHFFHALVFHHSISRRIFEIHTELSRAAFDGVQCCLISWPWLSLQFRQGDPLPTS